MCEYRGDRGYSKTTYTRVVMTIREKFADLRFLVSKYKDTSMVLLFFTF
jgi:hypothetical protein